MKKLRLLPLLVLALLCLASTALAANIPGQQSISSVSDASGYVTSLTDDNNITAWSKTGSGSPDLTISLYSGTVGEIWIRNGYAYSSNYYNHYDRVGAVKVTVYYAANRYTESYDSYRYTLADAFKPGTQSGSWRDGYQRLLLPKKYTGVTKIELTVESAFAGYGRTGATISDIIVAAGSHATATPKAYATATPKPYTVYVTPTPGPWTEEDDDPYVDYITPLPKDEADDNVSLIKPVSKATPTPLVELITPKPKATPTPLVELITPKPKVTATPLVELITPKPIITASPEDYPSPGVVVPLLKTVATRSGPGTRFDEPGAFFSAGDPVNVVTQANDGVRNWYQIEFQYKGKWYRAYTTAGYLDIGDLVFPAEPDRDVPLMTLKAQKYTREIFFGPGEEYAVFTKTAIHPGTKLDIYAIEGDWLQVDYTDYGSTEDPYPQRRGWVPANIVAEE
ncbi:MAG: hypothetical protein IJB81_01535 [Clostridia bacterium]|nr:hypothetical protein [Clostridia bacterium]